MTKHPRGFNFKPYDKNDPTWKKVNDILIEEISMAGHDNSFEKQMIEFYGLDKISLMLNKMSDNTNLKDSALTSISLDIALKSVNISKAQLESAKNKIQIELYAQLERDRNKKPSNNSIDNLTWVDKKYAN